MSKVTVLNPLGFAPDVAPKRYAPRLDSLDGKTVFLIDVNFNDADRLLARVAEWFAREMPRTCVRTVVLRQGYHRYYPELYEEIRRDGDAAIVAIGHCSGCAPWVTRHAIALEHEYGVPTVPLHVSAFHTVVRSVARDQGLSDLPMVFLPTPVMGRSNEQMMSIVDGDDAVTGKKAMDEVIEALTRPLAAGNVQDRASIDRLLKPDTEDNLQLRFQESGWTDFFPVVLPTESRVEAMLAGTCAPRDEVIGTIAPNGARAQWSFTVEKVAVNAVMAGARPEYMPVILGLATSGLGARMSTTTSAASMALVNGPIRTEIGMNCGIGALGPYNHANATIGRAYGLLSQNLQGGSVPGDTYMGSQGNGYTYGSLTFAENEERSPWEPFHVQHGFAPDRSTVSVFHGNRITTFLMGLREKHWQEHVRIMLRAINPGKEAPTLLLDPIAARQFVDRGGFTDKAALVEWLYDNARLPAEVFWDYQTVYNYKLPAANRGEEPYASNLTAARDELVPMFPKDKINVIVVGGETNAYWRIMGNNHVATVGIDKWRADRTFTAAAAECDDEECLYVPGNAEG